MILSIIIAVLVSIVWVAGIDYMDRNHPDYDGDDFLN
jgi:hypothetical protein